MQHLLAETRHGMTAFVIGTEAMLEHVADAGLKVMNNTDLATRADLVIVSGTEEVTYDDVRTASLALRRGADFLATSRDPTYPMPDGLWPGTGAVLAAVETASGREAAHRRQARAAALPDGARAARRGQDARGRRPDRLRRRGGEARRPRRRARADAATRRPRRRTRTAKPAPIAVADNLLAPRQRDGMNAGARPRAREALLDRSAVRGRSR